MLLVVSPVLHKYFDPPPALSLVLSPKQIESGIAATLTEGIGFTVILIES